MAKTKKLLTLILSFLCAVCFAFALASCNGNNDPDGFDGYEVRVYSIGGMPLEDVLVNLYEGDVQKNSARTDENGAARFEITSGSYIVMLGDLPAGYDLPETPVTVTAENKTAEIRLVSHVIDSKIPTGYRYNIGSVMYDFTLPTTNGEKTLSELLETKRMVLLNFWATWCGPCQSEFPYMQTSYENHHGDDEAEIIAISRDDDLNAVREFANANGLTFPMGYDTVGLHSYFGISSIPVSVVIDRYGVFAYRHVGAIRDVQTFDTLFERYCSEEYVPPKPEDPVNPDNPDKPDVTMPESSVLEAAANSASFKGTYRPVTEAESAQYEYFWPWLAGEDEKGTYIYSSNVLKQKNSTSLVYLDFHMEKNQMLVFDYDISTETELDNFYVFKDNYAVGKQIFTASGIHENQTAYVYISLEAGDHTIGLCYQTDQANENGAPYTDLVKIRNIRLVDKSELPAGENMNIRYDCATGPVQEGELITGWQHYVEVDLNKDDGYYHLLDGNGNPTGPYVLANLLGATHWSNASVSSYIDNGTSGLSNSDVNKLNAYIRYASLSDIDDYTPVTQELKDLLVKLTALGTSKPNEWLEICSYYIHYGTEGEDLNARDPIEGCAPFNAITLKETAGIPEEKYELYNEIVITKIFVPRGIYAQFIPDTTGLYRFKAYGVDPQTKEELSTICYITDENGELLTRRSDDEMIYFVNHFEIYLRMEAGKKYFVRCDMAMAGMLGTFYVGVEKMDHDVALLRNMTSGIYTFDVDVYDSTGEYYYYPDILPYNYEQNEDGDWVANRGLDGIKESKIYLNMTGTTAFSDIFGGISLEQILSDENLIGDGIYTYMEKDASGDPIYATDENGNPKYENGKPVYKTTYKLDFDFTRNDGINYAIKKNFNDVMKGYLERAKANNGLVEVDEQLGEILTMFAHRVSIWRNPDGKFIDENVIVGHPTHEWVGLCYYYEYFEA